jgi:hypothetical protein
MSLLDRGPLFVVGAQRSGTSWVQRLLAAHPAIVGGQESHLFSGYLAPMWWRWETEAAERARGRTVGLACYLTEGELEEEMRRLARRVFAHLERAKPGARLLVEKTPDHGLHLRLIKRLFPDAAIVHVLRDGRDVAASLRDASTRRWGASWAPARVDEAADRWAKWVRAIQRDMPLFTRTRTIRYEDLSADGPTVLAELYDFVGEPIPFHEVTSICDRGAFEVSAAGAADSLVLEGALRGSAGAEPEGFHRRGRVGGWKTDLTIDEQVLVHAIAGDLLRELGYS